MENLESKTAKSEINFRRPIFKCHAFFGEIRMPNLERGSWSYTSDDHKKKYKNHLKIRKNLKAESRPRIHGHFTV